MHITAAPLAASDAPQELAEAILAEAMEEGDVARCAARRRYWEGLHLAAGRELAMLVEPATRDLLLHWRAARAAEEADPDDQEADCPLLAARQDAEDRLLVAPATGPGGVAAKIALAFEAVDLAEPLTMQIAADIVAAPAGHPFEARALAAAYLDCLRLAFPALLPEEFEAVAAEIRAAHAEAGRRRDAFNIAEEAALASGAAEELKAAAEAAEVFWYTEADRRDDLLVAMLGTVTTDPAVAAAKLALVDECEIDQQSDVRGAASAGSAADIRAMATADAHLLAGYVPPTAVSPGTMTFAQEQAETSALYEQQINAGTLGSDEACATCREVWDRFAAASILQPADAAEKLKWVAHSLETGDTAYDGQLIQQVIAYLQATPQRTLYSDAPAMLTMSLSMSEREHERRARLHLAGEQLYPECEDDEAAADELRSRIATAPGRALADAMPLIATVAERFWRLHSVAEQADDADYKKDFSEAVTAADEAIRLVSSACGVAPAAVGVGVLMSQGLRDTASGRAAVS